MTKPSSISKHPSRREFCCAAAVLLASQTLPPTLAQLPAAGSPTRPDVASIDRDRILAAAQRFLSESPVAITTLPAPHSPGTPHDYYSSATLDSDTAPAPFTAHRDAVFALGLAVPALAAAYSLTKDERYASHAMLHLQVWFVDPATRMTPTLVYGQMKPAAPSEAGAAPTGRFQGILETLPLIEVALSIPFLAASAEIKPADLAAVRAWFAAYQHWLTAPEDSGPRLPALARDQKDHHGLSWLLQTAAYAVLAAGPGDAARSEDTMLGTLRQHLKRTTLRAQVSPTGTFPRELSSSTPYRDSLFSLDMLAGISQLLSTRFESAWDYQLEDGPSMRAAIAYHYPYIADRGHWPFRADVQHFDQLPGRRAALLFAARAYQRPEYASLWKTLPPDPASPDVLRTLPIHQPLLWVRQPPPPA